MTRVGWIDRFPGLLGGGSRATDGDTASTKKHILWTALWIGVVVAATAGMAVALASVGVAQGDAQSPGVDSQVGVDQQLAGELPMFASADDQTTVSGQIEFVHEDGHVEPARQVEIRVLRDGTLYNSELATTTTDDQGQYSVSIDVAEHTGWFSDELDIYVEARAENPGAEVVSIDNWANFDRNLGTYAHREEATVSEGTSQKSVDVTVTEQDDRRAFQIANAALEGYEFTKDEADWARDQVKIDYPARIGGDMYISPIDRIRITRDNWDHDKDVTVHHEYGHAIKYDLYDTGAWEIPGIETWLRNEDGDWFPCHVKYSETDENYAWYEGFAEFMEAAINDDPQVRGDLVNNKYYKMDKEHPECHDGSDGSEYNGDRVEGAIASILWNIYADTGQEFDDMNEPLSEILGTVSADAGITSEHPERNVEPVYDINAFWDQFVTEENHDDLRKIFFNYGIQKPDRHGPNDDIDSAAPINPDETIEAQLNFNEVDYFELELGEGDQIDIDLTKQLGDSQFDIEVYDPDEELYAKRLDSDVRDLRFEVAQTGTHYIRIADNDPAGTAAAYEFTVDREPGSNGLDLAVQETTVETDSLTLFNVTEDDETDEDETDDDEYDQEDMPMTDEDDDWSWSLIDFGSDDE